jgi:hypothetical protein
MMACGWACEGACHFYHAGQGYGRASIVLSAQQHSREMVTLHML